MVNLTINGFIGVLLWAVLHCIGPTPFSVAQNYLSHWEERMRLKRDLEATENTGEINDKIPSVVLLQGYKL